MKTLVLALLMVTMAVPALADELAAGAPGRRVVATEVAPGPMARPRRRPPLPRLITQRQLQDLVLGLRAPLNAPHQQCLRQFQPDRRVQVRLIVSLQPRTREQIQVRARPSNPRLEQCLIRRTQPTLRRQLAGRTSDIPIRAATTFTLTPTPVVDIPPHPDVDPSGLQVRQQVERALTQQTPIFRRCFPNARLGGRATLRIGVARNGTLQLLGASLPPDSGTGPLNCLSQLVATTPTGLTTATEQTVSYTLQLSD